MVNQRAFAQPLRLLRGCLHLLMAVLLALTAVRALGGGGPDAAPVFATAAGLGILYAAVLVVRPLRRAPFGVVGWLAGLLAVWLLLIGLTADGVWIAFPLFFLQLHLLPPRLAIPVVAGTTVAAIMGFGWHHHGVTLAGVIGPVLGAAVAVATVLGYAALYRESEERRRLIEELTAVRQDRDAAERAAGVLAERERLAREIHDTVAQGLSSIQLVLRAAERCLPARPEEAAGHVDQARRTAHDNLAEARRLVHALAPPGLADGSLPAALERLCTTTTEESGVPVHLHLSGTPCAVPTAVEVALLRIAQSALANTVQHAGASRAEVTVSYMDVQLALDVVDDGVGFDPSAAPARGARDGGFGLAAMRARSRDLGGRMSVESGPGQGTAVAVSFPHNPGDGPGRGPAVDP